MAKYLLFDTETTGANEEDRIIQLGLMVVHSKESIEIYDEICSTDIPIKLEAMEVHNIIPSMLIGKPNCVETTAYQKILEFNNNSNYLIAHNIKFDLNMLIKEGFENKYKIIDTLRCARHLFSDLPFHRLQYIRYALELYKIEDDEAKSLNIQIKAHDAIGDVLIMKLFLSELIKKVKEEYINENPMDKLVELTETPVKVKTFRFGKYRGEHIESVASHDIGYISWMRANMKDLDEDMKYTLDFYLNIGA